MNVLLTLDKKLVLADFGIALHSVDRPVRADCFNAWYAPDSVFRASANWEPRDDVWQLGQLMAFLMDGSVDSPIRPEDVGRLDCPDKAKAIIYRSIAPRQHRLEHAGRVLDIWESYTLPFSRANRIDGLGVVFTGPGSLPRSELERITRRAGGIPQRKVSKKTGIVVVGGNSSLWAAGSEGGKKILAALEQRDRGTAIRFIQRIRCSLPLATRATLNVYADVRAAWSKMSNKGARANDLRCYVARCSLVLVRCNEHSIMQTIIQVISKGTTSLRDRIVNDSNLESLICMSPLRRSRVAPTAGRN